MFAALTLAQWLDQFAAGAAQLPGWQLAIDGKLRRLSGRLWDCPLMAQWNAQYPSHPVASSHSVALGGLWISVLSIVDIHALMDAADSYAESISSAGLRTLRRQLLAACGVEEGAC